MNSECQRCDLCIISPVYCSYFQSSTLCNSPTLSSFPTPFISSFHRLCRSANPLILLLLSFPHSSHFPSFPSCFITHSFFLPLLPFSHSSHFPTLPISPLLSFPLFPPLVSFSHSFFFLPLVSFHHFFHFHFLLSCPLLPPHFCQSPSLSSYPHLCHSPNSFIFVLFSFPFFPHWCRSPLFLFCCAPFISPLFLFSHSFHFLTPLISPPSLHFFHPSFLSSI